PFASRISVSGRADDAEGAPAPIRAVGAAAGLSALTRRAVAQRRADDDPAGLFVSRMACSYKRLPNMRRDYLGRGLYGSTSRLCHHRRRRLCRLAVGARAPHVLPVLENSPGEAASRQANRR